MIWIINVLLKKRHAKMQISFAKNWRGRSGVGVVTTTPPAKFLKNTFLFGVQHFRRRLQIFQFAGKQNLWNETLSILLLLSRHRLHMSSMGPSMIRKRKSVLNSKKLKVLNVLLRLPNQEISYNRASIFKFFQRLFTTRIS